MLRFLVVVVFAFISSCTGVRTHDCTNGAEGIEAAAAFAAEHWPDARADAEDLLVSCKPQSVIETSISSCALSDVERPESCAVFKAAPGRSARIDVSHDEDAAIATCHELFHLRGFIWFTDDRCQSHLMSCGYDQVEVARCEQAVFDFRGL